MRILSVVASAGLLLTLASCGDHSSNSHKARPSLDPLVTSADWKITLEGKTFPNKTMVVIDDEIVVNECANKQSYFINRETEPQMLPLPSYRVPQKPTVKVEVLDMGDGCDAESNFLVDPETHYEMTKDGAHADILIRL